MRRFWGELLILCADDGSMEGELRAKLRRMEYCSGVKNAQIRKYRNTQIMEASKAEGNTEADRKPS